MSKSFSKHKEKDDKDKSVKPFSEVMRKQAQGIMPIEAQRELKELRRIFPDLPF